MQLPEGPPRRGPRTSGFTIVEVLVASGVLGLAAVGIFGLASQAFVVLKGSREDSAAALALEYRLEQVRRSTWNAITSQEPPPDAFIPEVDLDDADYTDPAEDTYTSEYINDLGDADLTPGAVALLAVTPDSLGSLAGASETFRIVPFPTTDAKQIVVTRTAAGAVSTAGSSSDYAQISLEDAVQVTAIISWQSDRGITRSLASTTIVSRADK